jgi:hypothetical protein
MKTKFYIIFIFFTSFFWGNVLAQDERPFQVLGGNLVLVEKCIRTIIEPNTIWQLYDANCLPIEGKGWADTQEYYDRFPAKAEAIVPGDIWYFSKQSAGMCIRFTTDSNAIYVKWTLGHEKLSFNNLNATSASGLDLYARDGRQFKMIGIATAHNFPENGQLIADGLAPGLHEYLLYLPLFNHVKKLYIGLRPDSSMYKAEQENAQENKPICFYGSSIVHGECASRPGNTYAAVLSRQLNRPVINLGFSGSARMEPVIADMLTELKPSVYVIDTLPNMTKEMVTSLYEPFIDKLKKVHPLTPVIICETIEFSNDFVKPRLHQAIEVKNDALWQICQRLRNKGYSGIYYVKRSELLYGAGTDGTVDCIHPNDLGFKHIAEILEPVLRKALKENIAVSK